jgi:hypothetical protein
MMSAVIQYQSYDSNSIDNEYINGCCLPGYLQLSRAEFCFCDSYNIDSLNVKEYMKLMNSIWYNKTNPVTYGTILSSQKITQPLLRKKREQQQAYVQRARDQASRWPAVPRLQ